MSVINFVDKHPKLYTPFLNIVKTAAKSPCHRGNNARGVTWPDTPGSSRLGSSGKEVGISPGKFLGTRTGGSTGWSTLV